MDNMELLDLLTIMSFILQVQNQSSIVGIGDLQEEASRIINDIHAHLTAQDKKINDILARLEVIQNEDNRKVS